MVINWEVNQSTGSESCTIQDLGVETQEEWNNLTHEEKEEKIQEYLDSLPERVFICVDNWKE